MYIIGVDTGGTFTDFIYRDEKGVWDIHKRLSTPANPAEAVIEGILHITDQKAQIVHGSTVATNALLERKGAKTALITNSGFTDILNIGRQNRSELYNLSFRKKKQLVDDDMKIGVEGRILKDGKILTDLSVKDAYNAVIWAEEMGAESIAVCFLFSFANPQHELLMADMLKNTGIPVSLSHQVVAEFREFERMSSTVVNAYVSPKMTGYVSYLLENIKDSSLSIMQSNGGSISADTAMRESVRTILSGPAGGAVGALEIGRQSGFDNLITFDMGGTSTDVSLIDGQLPLTTESEIAGNPVRVPMIDIHTVGAGGGSIAYIDEGGSLRVGPESAGANPGPICYGKGEQITVTDANLYLGRLVPDRFLGGKMSLDRERINKYFDELAALSGLDPVTLAEGIISVADTAMERALRVISVEKGFNPAEFTLFSFGGAGGMHAVQLARLLGMQKVFVPKNPGILSAVGMLMADVIKDYSITVMKDSLNWHPDEIIEKFAGMEFNAFADMKHENVAEKDVIFERYADMRYVGQSFEIMTPFGDDFINEFHRLHEKQYGYASYDKDTEIVNLRLRARGVRQKPELEKIEQAGTMIAPNAVSGKTTSVFKGKEFETLVVERENLLAGNRLAGPAIICEYSSTIVIPPDSECTVDEFGNLLIDTWV